MHEFRVWAPRPGRVELVLGDERIIMRRTGRGWWAGAVEGAGPGTDYAFSLDGGPPRSDPRSAHQPHGVHGPSRLVDHDQFPWTDRTWRGRALSGSILYECHIGTFSEAGTFDGAIDHLGHLADLGVDAIEVMPVAEFPGRWGWGYDGVDLFAPHHAYGGPDGLKRFVDAAHDRGLAVVMDVVYNHLGPAANYLPEFGPYFSARRQTNWGDAVNFDGPGSDEVRDFVIDNALLWLRDYHCDGLRLDAVQSIMDDSAVPILESLGREVEALAAATGRPLFVIAESDLNDPRFVRSRDAGGMGPRRRLGRRMASRPARHPDGREERVLRGLRTRCPPGEGPPPGLGVRRDLLGLSRPRPWPAPGRARRQPVCGLHPESRPGRQPGQG
jgi:maltooligosyltrehalose trehalohydrolase